jgi:putative transposase
VRRKQAMKLLKTFKYRIYPADDQVSRLIRWESALRFLWNVAHEQRLFGLARSHGTQRFYSAFDQQKELTVLRAELPWLADVPRNACGSLLEELDKAWQRFFQKIARRPLFKKNGRGTIGVRETCNGKWRVRGTEIVFPKIGSLKAVMHRPVAGKPRTCALVRESNQWFACLTYELEIADPEPRFLPAVGVDRGVVHLLAESGGRITRNPRFRKSAFKRLRRASRSVARKLSGSRNSEKAKSRLSKIHRKIRRQRQHLLHVESARIAKSHGVVVIEDLQVANMARTRRGSLGAHVTDAAWSTFAWMLEYKLRWSGGFLITVPPQYSSQTCAACGSVDASSRRGDLFCCVECGHADHSDVNAAKIFTGPCESLGTNACGG